MDTVLVVDELQRRALGAPAGWRVASWEEFEAGAVPAADVRFVVISREGGVERRRRMRDLPAVERVQVMSVGFDYVMDHLPSGARLHNAAAVIAETTAEQGLLNILAALRRLPDYVRAQDRADWVDVDDPTSEIPAAGLRSLVGATVVQLGHGVVGKALARRLAACGAEVVAFARSARIEAGRPVLPLAELDEWLPRADVVASALPLSPATRGLVDAAFLARMKDGALFSNVGRGATVDTADLTAAVATGRIGASLDVVDPEPLPADHPLWRLPNVLLTPHMAGDHRGTLGELAALVAAQFEAYRTGRPLVDDVTAMVEPSLP
ncbi:NAD(P)-dependent oxidoreductase [Pseudonocardia oroxyli]|uniref:Phosphoglycerate dehydrogenase n=1 Tax=Pseudonocardia oroxyli TaxID=366584 RepID=A0A1G7TWW7_PSEOR|nr:NAD(P)-dependent oxidoreductase [Pseudonocardia oroxyli]SDG39766.1 Phosphoglycerate dehydrogenase [Pseudonocardia oroxyli]